jgi:hypothetical protein
MQSQIEDLIRSSCSSVTLSSSNDIQRTYIIANTTEARTVFEVLFAHGFDVKIYDQDDSRSKLYVSQSPIAQSQLDNALHACKLYISAATNIRNALETTLKSQMAPLNLEAKILFSAPSSSLKHITCQIIDVNQHNTLKTPPINEDPSPVTALRSVDKKTFSNTQKYKAKGRSKEDEFAAGPVVGRGKNPKAKKTDPNTNEEITFKGRITHFISGNIANSSYAALIMAAGLAAILSLLIFAKGLLCPDFASLNNQRAWYCKIGETKNADNQERYIKIGPPPTTEP